MPELKITPIVPEDDEPQRGRRPSKGSSRSRSANDDEGSSSPRIMASQASEPVGEEEEFDAKAVEEEVKRRYGMDAVKVSQVKRSRSGANVHKTGSTRK
jgi:hypothetical protein